MTITFDLAVPPCFFAVIKIKGKVKVLLLTMHQSYKDKLPKLI